MSDYEVDVRPGNTKPLEVDGQVFKSAFDWDLSENDLKRAVRELGETEEKKKACLQKLKEKLSSKFKLVN